MNKAVVVDDEKSIRKLIVGMLSKHFPEITEVAEADSVSSGIEVIEKIKPDIVFLDIEIKEGEGFDILKRLSFRNFSVVFITAFNQYAIKAIKFSAIDYLLKPIIQEEFLKCVQKALAIESQASLHKQLDNYLLNWENHQNKKLALKTSESIYFVLVTQIVALQSDNTYTTFWMVGGENILVSKNIKFYEELLGDLGFIRPHQSFLVNTAHIKRFDKQDGGYLVMDNMMEIPVSVRRKSSILRILESI